MTAPAPTLPAPRLTGVFPFLKRYPLVVIAGSILAAILFAAVFAPFMGTTDPDIDLAAPAPQAGSETFWLGTDQLGRDIWSRLVYGARVSLLVGGAVAVLSITAGLVIGLWRATSAGSTPSSCASWTG